MKAQNYCRCGICGGWGARAQCSICHRRMHAYCGRYRQQQGERFLVCSSCNSDQTSRKAEPGGEVEP